MITVISGTNRSQSRTQFVSRFVVDHAKTLSDSVNYLDLSKIAPSFVHPSMYHVDNITPELKKIQDAIIIPAQKFLVVVPEYNGSYPGFFKMFIDALSARNAKESFKGKKIAFIGISSSKNGNAAGIEHLGQIFTHIGMEVLPKSLPLAEIESLIVRQNLKLEPLRQVHDFVETFHSF